MYVCISSPFFCGGIILAFCFRDSFFFKIRFSNRVVLSERELPFETVPRCTLSQLLSIGGTFCLSPKRAASLENRQQQISRRSGLGLGLFGTSRPSNSNPNLPFESRISFLEMRCTKSIFWIFGTGFAATVWYVHRMCIAACLCNAHHLCIVCQHYPRSIIVVIIKYYYPRSIIVVIIISMILVL